MSHDLGNVACWHRLTRPSRLAGHSLGAAVAMLCALRLHALHQHQGSRANVRCYTFGAPAIGNKVLAAWVSSSNFHHDFHNFILPGESFFWHVSLIYFLILYTLSCMTVAKTARPGWRCLLNRALVLQGKRYLASGQRQVSGCTCPGDRPSQHAGHVHHVAMEC